MDYSKRWRKTTFLLSWSFALVVSQGKSINFKQPTSSPCVHPYKFEDVYGRNLCSHLTGQNNDNLFENFIVNDFC